MAELLSRLTESQVLGFIPAQDICGSYRPLKQQAHFPRR